MMHVIHRLHASERLEAGMTIHTLADRLGHADPAYTLRTYTRPTSHSTDHETEERLPARTPRPLARSQRGMVEG